MNNLFKKNRIVPVLPSTGIDNRAETMVRIVGALMLGWVNMAINILFIGPI